MQIEYHDNSGHKRYKTFDYEYPLTDSELTSMLWAARIEKVVLLMIEIGLFSRLRISKRTLTD